MSAHVSTVVDNVKAKNTDRTGSQYAGSIRAFVEWCESEGRDVFGATPLDVEDYLQDLADDGYAYDSVQGHRSALVAFYDRAVRVSEGTDVPDPRSEYPRESHWWENPAKAVGMGDIDMGSSDTHRDQVFGDRADDDGAALTPDEMGQLIDHVPAPKVRNQLLVSLMYQGMLRRGEAARIRLKNVNRDKNPREIFLPASDTKTGEEHTVYYDDTLDHLMSLWVESDRESVDHSDSPYLFPTNASERLSDGQVTKIVVKAAERAPDVEQEVLYTDARGRERRRITGHSPRRAGATRRWKKTEDIYTVKELLNHNSVETTRQYLRLTDEDLAEKARDSW